MSYARKGVVIESHQRSYDTAISFKKGERVSTSKEDVWDDQFVWIWCISKSNGEGWVPDQFLQLEEGHASALRDYNAIGLTVTVGEHVHISGFVCWCWVQNSDGDQGWIPTKKVEST